MGLPSSSTTSARSPAAAAAAGENRLLPWSRRRHPCRRRSSRARRSAAALDRRVRRQPVPQTTDRPAHRRGRAGRGGRSGRWRARPRTSLLDHPGPVDVLQVSGPVRPDRGQRHRRGHRAIHRGNGAEALVPAGPNTRGAVVGRDEIEALMKKRIAAAPPPVADPGRGRPAPWVYGTPAQLLAVADVSGHRRRAPSGGLNTGAPLRPERRGGRVRRGRRRRCGPARSASPTPAASVSSISVSPTRGSTVANMVDALDGYAEGDVVLETSEERILDDGNVCWDTTATCASQARPRRPAVQHRHTPPSLSSCR